MIKHVVMWKFKENAPLEEIKKRLEGMRKTVPLVVDLEVGIDFLHSERSWDMVLILTLEKAEDLSAYGNHPAHLPVAAFIGEWKVAGASVDYLA